MGTPKTTFVGNRWGGFRVDYVRARRVLRITGLVGEIKLVGPVECDFDRLVQALGIEISDAGPFLVFGGIYGSPVEGGSRDFRGAYRDLAAAKVAFTELRLGDGEWGEVVRVEKGKLVQKCWFGERERKPSPASFGGAGE